MSKILEPIRRVFTPVEPIPAGIYHYIAPQDDPRNYRLHLRVEHDGQGLLIVNASTVLHLNQTASEYAYYFLQNLPADQVAHKMTQRYRIDSEQARIDYRNFNERILTLIETPDLDPITFLDFNRQEPYSGRISAPYRLDCALTYRLPETHDPESAPTKRVSRELSTSEWGMVLDKAWQAGIPHVIFTGGEPTLRDDLVQLIAHAERNGQVSGLLTDGLRLADQDYIQALLQTGLDHLLVVLHPSDESIWETLKTIVDEDIYLAVHLTIKPENADQALSYLDRLAMLGVPAISLSASQAELDPTLEAARNHAASLQMELVWDIPVPYSTHNPVALELAESEAEQPEGAGKAWLYIEPDGDVLPGQGVEKVLGNALKEPWEKIWEAAGN